jgi:hypothetical protein
MRSPVLTWFSALAVVVSVLGVMSHAAKTDPANVKAYGAFHGIVISPYNG